MISVLIDLNVNANNWCKEDFTFHVGFMIEAVISNYRLQKIFQEQTNILNLPSPFIDPVFNT